MRDGHLLQVDTPHRLYSEPVNLFVAGFIGSPAMNLVEANVEAGVVRFAGYSVPLAPDRRVPDGPVVLGIRPESFEDARFAPGLPTIDVVVEVLEDLGSDAHVFFPVEARSITAEVLEAGDEAQSLVDGTALMTARVDARTGARVAQRLVLAVDAERFHFFDPQSGDRLLPQGAADSALAAR